MGDTEKSLVDQREASKGGGQGMSNVQETIAKLGDIKGFGISVVYYAFLVVLLGYVGATVINITNMSGREIDELFPTDLQNFPYQTPIGRMNPAGNSIHELYTQFHASDDGEALTKASLEFIYPMKRQSFPYKSWFLEDAFRGTKGHTIAQWFASTCAGTFCAWRKMYKILIVISKWVHTVAYDVADFVFFYIWPYVAIWLIMMPIIPWLGFIISIFSSIMYNIPGGWLFTFAPAIGFLVAVANIFTAGILNIFAWVMSIIIFGFGFMMGFVNMAWWALIGLALWAYTIAFLVISPLLHKGGMKNVVEEFKKKRKGLMVIYIFLVVLSAVRKLNNALKTGFIVGALICLYKVYKMPSTAGLGESASKAAVAAAAAAHKAAQAVKG